MANEDNHVPSSAVPYSEAVRCYATSPFRASLPHPFPGVENYMGHFPKELNAAEREAMACLRRDLAAGACQAWGRAKSPLSSWSRVPGESWRYLQYLDVGQEKFGLLPCRPETSVWSCRTTGEYPVKATSSFTRVAF
jgi:hypothetical protein